MHDKILVVEDEKSIAEIIEIYLQNEGYSIYKCFSAEEALECIESIEHDLAILDVMLPKQDGFYLCKKIREKYSYPIIMLTAKNDQNSKVNGFTYGADDYVTKPFLPLELMARIKAQLRRYKKYNFYTKEDKNNNFLLSSQGVELNIKARECRLDGKVIRLTPSEYDILRILLEHKGEVVSSEDIFHSLWSDEYYSKNNNTVTVHIRHIREKLGNQEEKDKYIKTVWGVGYKIE